MDATTERPTRLIWIGVGLLAIILALAFWAMQFQQPPAATLPVLGQIENFSLTNQLGQAVTLANLRGKVWLADIIFTRCPGPCARMTRQMASVQSALPKDSAAQLVSLTTDPGYDTPAILQAYPARLKLEAYPARWQFLTGTKTEIANLGINSLKLAAVDKAPAERTEADDLFIHATIFVLVDKQARLRGIYQTDGEVVTWADVQPAILAAVKQLENER